jgi:hypothetical protein
MTRAIPGFPILGFPTPAPQDHGGGHDRNDKNEKNDRNDRNDRNDH